MLPGSLYQRISAINRSWGEKAGAIADPEERASRYRAVYAAYTSLVETVLRIDIMPDEGQQIVAVMELENRLHGFERTLRAQRAGSAPVLAKAS
jgi:hypothetical protein